MIQILFEGLIRVMREYVSEKKKYFQTLNDIEQRWEYSDKKKSECKNQAESEFNALKKDFIDEFTGNITALKRRFRISRKISRLIILHLIMLCSSSQTLERKKIQISVLLRNL